LSFRRLTNNLKIKTYITVILSFDLYGCKTWSVTLSQECRVRDNWVFRKYGPKKEDVTAREETA